MHRFKIALFAVLFAALPVVLAAQKTLPGTGGSSQPAPEHRTYQQSEGMPFMGHGPGMRVEESLKVLQRNLNLSEAQAAQVKQIVDSRRTRFESIREEGRPKFRQLMALLNKPNPDPTAVGQATIALKQVHEKAMTEQANLEKDFLNVLNNTQRQTVNSLREKAPTVMALHRLGLLTPENNAEQTTALFNR
jgi:Spy/CpxP family protein refolding chaperone